MKLRDMAERLRDELSGVEGLQSVGFAEKGELNPHDFLVVYVEKKKHLKKVPTEFYGFKVKGEVIGKIEIIT